MNVEKELVCKNEAYQIIGAAMAVHNELGSGMREIVYGDALEIELKLRGIPFQREQTFTIFYKGVELQHKFKCDFICFKNIIVEIKAEKGLTDIDRSQIINYLKITKCPLGILINFGESSLMYERYI
ncbi:GxxExxY protein [Prevotella sp. oral taxon 306 str. F0472]|uniref:GxxExxY protein n=1 Tax=Prevotella sp. oral taxon 306 TaxID=712461 RepID=UPI00025BBF83|nr:GxxExxY protein [Prevotella sp. oral taxon 306]EID32348.1 GxxExxY protein [Prevotella sp. oral taxon 306 str. F0472]